MEGQQPIIWGLGITFPVIAITSVILRFHARQLNAAKFQSDDWTIVIALILSIGVTIVILLMTEFGGLGTHSQYDKQGNPLDPGAVMIFGKTTYALQILTWPAVGMTKISVLLMYKRIFSSPTFLKMAWALIALITAWTIAFTLALTFACTPIASQWDFTLEFTCVDQKALFTTALATDATTDFLVLFLPIWKVWQLNMPVVRKILLIGIFLLGSLVSVIGIVRIHYLTKIYNVLASSPAADTTWIYAQVFYWTIIETNVGVLSACLPTLRPIQKPVSLIFIKLRNSFSNLIPSSGSREAATTIRLGSMDENGVDYYREDNGDATIPKVSTKRYRKNNLESESATSIV